MKRMMPIVLLAALLIAPAAAPEAMAQTAPSVPGAHLSRPLADEPWQDRSWGISVRLPVDTRVLSQTVDREFLFRAEDEHREFTMSLKIKRTASALSLDKIAQIARDQIESLQGTSEVLQERTTSLMNRPAFVIHGRVPGDGIEALLSQAIIQIDPQTFAVFESRCNMVHGEKVRALFEASIATLNMEKSEQLDEQRQVAVQAGQEWRTSLKLAEIEAALIPEQWFRLTRDGKDIGFMVMRQRRGQRDALRGTEIELEVHMPQFDGSRDNDSIAHYFLSDDGRQEIWKVTTTVRQAGSRPAPNVQPLTYVETGIRTDDQIVVTFDSNEGSWRAKKEKMDRPPVGYLSQVEALLMPQLLPMNRPATYGFYFYHSRAGKITYRSDQVTPALTGFSVVTRLSPNDPELRGNYTAQRRLVEKQLSATEKQTPATPVEIRNRWSKR